MHDPDAPDPLRWRAMGVIAVAQLLIVLDATILTIALPTVQDALHIGPGARSWVLTGYTLAFGGLLLMGGRIADYTGRKRALIAGLLGFAAASILGSLAHDEVTLFVARALQGAMAALIAPAALSLLTITFTSPRERATAFGIYGTIAAGGGAVGSILGGLLTTYTSWRWALLIGAPVAIIAVLGALPWVRESKADGRTRYDLPGAVTSALGVVALVLALQNATPSGLGGRARWGSPWTLSMLVGAVLLLGAFVFIESRSQHPLLPLRIVLDRNRVTAFAMAFLTGSSMLGVIVFLSYYAQQTLGYSALRTGASFFVFTPGVIVGGVLSTKFTERLGTSSLLAVGPIIAAVGMFQFTFLGVVSTYWPHILIGLLVIGVGTGMTFGPLTNRALTGIGPSDAGVASAFVSSIQQLGGSVGVAVLNTIAVTATGTWLAGHTAFGDDSAGQALAAVHGYRTVFWVGTTLMALAAAIAAVGSQRPLLRRHRS